MNTATPDYGDVTSRLGDFLRYPRRVLIQALELAFAEPYLFTDSEDGVKVENPFLYKKTEDGETATDSKLEIADTWADELNATDPRPIVIVQRDALTFTNASINRQHGFDVPSGSWKKHADLLRVPLNFLCFARKDLESEELAFAVAMVLRFFSDRIKARTRLEGIESPAIGTVTPVTTDAKIDLFSTPVSTVVSMTIQWRVIWTDLKEVSQFNIEQAIK